jgi:F-type H+-transporting ATPase subunit b
MPQLDMSTWPPQLIWLAITFSVLYYVISTLVIPKLGGVIEQRKSNVEGDLAAAQRLKLETEAAVKAYEGSLAAARSQAQDVMAKNRDALNHEMEGGRAKLDQTLATKIAAAEKRIAGSREAAMKQVGTLAADLAAQIASQLTGARITKAAAAAAIPRARAK